MGGGRERFECAAVGVVYSPRCCDRLATQKRTRPARNSVGTQVYLFGSSEPMHLLGREVTRAEFAAVRRCTAPLKLPPTVTACCQSARQARLVSQSARRMTNGRTPGGPWNGRTN